MTARPPLVWLALGLALALVGLVAALVLRGGDATRPPGGAPSSAAEVERGGASALESEPVERTSAAAPVDPRASLADDPAARAEAERRSRSRTELERALADLAQHRTLQAAREVCEQAVALSIDDGGAGEVVTAPSREKRARVERDREARLLERDGRCWAFRAGQYPEYDELCALLASGPKAIASLEPARLEALLGRIEARARAALGSRP